MTIPESGCYMDNDTSCLPCTPEEEKRVVDELTKDAESNLKEGNLYYVLSNGWYMDWLRYTGQDTGDNMFDRPFVGPLSQNGNIFETPIRPGQIDNSHLVLDGSDADGIDLDMHKTLEERRDYVLVPQEVWKKFHDWYKGGPALPRKLISQGVAHKTYIVEVYPLTLKLTDSRDGKKLIIRMSKKESVRALYDKVCSLLDLDPGKVKIWDYFNERKHKLLSVSDEGLEEACLQIDQDILLEVQSEGFHSSSFGMDSTGNELALVAIDPASTSISIAGGPAVSNSNYYSSGCGYNLNKGNGLSLPLATADDGNDMFSSVKKCGGGGLAGLQNLGNTCFMNSSLQCLFHTPPLVEYFLQDYTEEINKQNPLGLHGELAIAFGDLLRKIWSSGRAPIAPRVFKGKLARFAPQFSGYNQHDSQELLAFLLDGLHEDLNRVKNKPYIEAKDANGRPDWKVANECWENHKARNDSVIVDVCQGQYKSTLVCPSCSKISVTFDPFMYLSLPLPSTVTRSMTITVLYGDGSALPMPFTVSVLKHGCVKDLMQALSDGPDGCCLKSDERLLLAEVHEHQIFRYLDNPYEQLSTIKDEDRIVAYRVPKVPEELTMLEIIFRSKKKCMSDISSGADSKPLGTPLVSCFADGLLTGADIQPLVHKMLVPLLRTTSASPSKQVQSNKSATSGDAMELDEALNGDSSSFHLWLTNERGTVSHPIDSEQVFEQGKTVRVLLEWSDRERELYDVSYIEKLPEVYKATGFIAKKNKHEAISLFSCLEAFLKEEPLGPDDMWYCPACKEHRQATKKLDLWRLPEILVFHLKRFSYSRYLKNKLDTFVNFPIRNLDLSKYVRSKDDPLSHFYELYAISNHYGGLGGGHYSAYAKLEGDKWYHFDDSHVSSVNEDEIKTSAAYVLFYRRVEVEREK
ncbi:hypothetical protein MKW94_030699 [Papaver nudicaule]|uniref:Ubiquitin carboxyl-terminal hydrolase n=1 Tax=Papaver nudicaule TaxID=74823 RepID=A0AA41VMU1_PAPNU|nr:hypothetical protein [Papaver nudicaule]